MRAASLISQRRPVLANKACDRSRSHRPSHPTGKSPQPALDRAIASLGRPSLVNFQRPRLRSRHRGAQPCRISRRRRPAARGHRPVARRQDRVHHRSGRESRSARAPPAGASARVGRGAASRAHRWSRSRTMRCRASPMRTIWPRWRRPQARRWPQSTRRISQLRLTIEFERAKGWGSTASTLTLDIVDYPGEWLLDLPLLAKSYAQWSRETLEASATAARAPAGRRLARLSRRPRSRRAGARRDRAQKRRTLHRLSAHDRREDAYALSTLPPGRFLMPGDLEGSPALTFAPLPMAEGAELRLILARRHDGAALRGL